MIDPDHRFVAWCRFATVGARGLCYGYGATAASAQADLQAHMKCHGYRVEGVGHVKDTQAVPDKSHR